MVSAAVGLITGLVALAIAHGQGMVFGDELVSIVILLYGISFMMRIQLCSQISFHYSGSFCCLILCRVYHWKCPH